ncbi:MAG TPA: enolase C-terminal domain-like protein [Propionibacteriaceae bacterium]|nr:enolase C-terminal domain-like protein [Propionibacteriaceae bacterium]
MVKIADVQVVCTAPEGINLVAVKVLTDVDGLYGLGCATFTYRHKAVVTLIEEYLKPLVMGRDAEQIEEIWQLMHQNAYWRYGPIENNAISGIDMALWDIKGKLASMPVYQLLGGKVREGVPVYRHADGRSLGELVENVQAWMESGVQYVRCQMGGYGGGRLADAGPLSPEGAQPGLYLEQRAYIRDTITMFEHVRSAVGFEVELLHDVHGRLKPIDAIRLAKSLEPYELFFLEDALALEDEEWFGEMRAQTTTPIAMGELFTNPFEWRRLIESRVIDFIRVHLTAAGGLTPVRKLQILAESYGVKTAWHGPGDMSPMAHAANIHLDVASRNFGIQEWSGTRPPNFILHDLADASEALVDVFPGLPEQRGGYVYPNDKPGWGIELDEKAAAKYPCHSGVTTWTQTRLRDGSLQTP